MIVNQEHRITNKRGTLKIQIHFHVYVRVLILFFFSSFHSDSISDTNSLISRSDYFPVIQRTTKVAFEPALRNL